MTDNEPKHNQFLWFEKSNQLAITLSLVRKCLYKLSNEVIILKFWIHAMMDQSNKDEAVPQIKTHSTSQGKELELGSYRMVSKSEFQSCIFL